MKLLLTLSLFISIEFSPYNSFGQVTDTLIGFVDLHVHTTLKNYTNFVYDPEDIPLTNNGNPIFSKNWTQVSFTKKNAKTSDFYSTQSDYTSISKGNYSIVCASIATAEKAHLDNWVKRLIAQVGGFKRKRMILRTKEKNTSFEYFLSEYRYQTLQDKSNGYSKVIEIAKNDTNLLSIINRKNIPVVLTVEGLNALMGEFLSRDKNFQDIRHGINETSKYEQDYKTIEKELTANLDSMKKLPYGIFFVSPTHHNWDYIAGQARYFDKNEKLLGIGYRKLIIKLLTPNRKGKRIFGGKNGTGIIDTLTQFHTDDGSKEPFTNKYSGKEKDSCKCPDERSVGINNFCWDKAHIGKPNIGRVIFASLLDRNNTRHKPIYIDVKHMDVQARLDYYKILDSLKKKGDTIPIIASHTGVSGKDLNLAYHTGLPPMYDDYKEIDNPAFYTKKHTKYADIRKCIPSLDQSYQNCKEDMKWFYPLSLNLYKEEIKTIYESDGLIGIILDERLLGAYAYGYKQEDYLKSLRNFSTSKGYNDEQKAKYTELVPFFRNLVYMVQNCGRKDKTAWDHLSIGSDFDGLVDPIDVCLTSADMGNFETLCINYFPDYLQQQGIIPNQLFLDQISINVAMKKVFRLNAYNFILKYF